jgi:hypothetical protein
LHDAAADAAFVQSLTRALRQDIPVHKLPLHINDPAFAEHCCRLLMELLAKPAGIEGDRQTTGARARAVTGGTTPR